MGLGAPDWMFIHEYGTYFGPLSPEQTETFLLWIEVVGGISIAFGALWIYYDKHGLSYNSDLLDFEGISLVICLQFVWMGILPYTRFFVFTMFSIVVSLLSCWLSGVSLGLESYKVSVVHGLTEKFSSNEGHFLPLWENSYRDIFEDLSRRYEVSFSSLACEILSLSAIALSAAINYITLELQVLIAVLIATDIYLCRRKLPVLGGIFYSITNQVLLTIYLILGFVYLPALIPFFSLIELAVFVAGAVFLRKSD